jgi:hypothetical protein
MTIEMVSYGAAQVGAPVAAAQSGAVCRVLMLAATCWQKVKITLLSDPNGGDERALTPPLHLGPGEPLVLRLGRLYALATDVGKSLGVTSEYESTVAELSLTAWVEWAPG